MISKFVTRRLDVGVSLQNCPNYGCAALFYTS